MKIVAAAVLLLAGLTCPAAADRLVSRVHLGRAPDGQPVLATRERAGRDRWTSRLRPAGLAVRSQRGTLRTDRVAWLEGGAARIELQDERTAGRFLGLTLAGEPGLLAAPARGALDRGSYSVSLTRPGAVLVRRFHLGPLTSSAIGRVHRDGVLRQLDRTSISRGRAHQMVTRFDRAGERRRTIERTATFDLARVSRTAWRGDVVLWHAAVERGAAGAAASFAVLGYGVRLDGLRPSLIRR